MNKSERQAALTRIINQKPIATQEELLAALKAAGIDATQATISRDIREMKIVKSQDATGTLRYTIFRGSSESQLERLGRSIREVGLSITRVHFMNVIKTLPSNGNLLAAIIDDIGFEQVVGTIAGHDTIVVRSRQNGLKRLIGKPSIRNHLATSQAKELGNKVNLVKPSSFRCHTISGPLLAMVCAITLAQNCSKRQGTGHRQRCV